MKNTEYIILSVLLILLIGGCSSKNVYFFNPEKVDDVNHAKNTVQLHVDAFGNLYPEEFVQNKFYIPNEEMHGSLCKIIYDDNNSLCLNITNNDTITELCNAIKKHPTIKKCTLNPFWMKEQSKLWSKKAEEIYQKATTAKEQNLFFLIHGFNNTSYESSKMFQEVKDEVISNLNNKDDKPLFVEIYWDGFTSSNPPSVWSKAQASGPLVGFNLRQLFREINISYNINKKTLPKVYVFTHSSGAFVAGALFGNPYSALPLLHNEDKDSSLNGNYEYINFRNYRDGNYTKYPIPDFPEIRIGMIAAATPSTTFIGDMNLSSRIDKDTKSGILSQNTSLILSINSNDYTLGKIFGLASWNSLGATGTGTDVDIYCRDLDKFKNLNNTYAFDFTSNLGFYFDFLKLASDSHAVSTYLKHNNASSFFKKLLDIENTNEGLITCSPKK